MHIGVGLIAVFALSAVHLFANQAKVLGWVWHGRFLSFASGLSFAYVFIDLLPALAKGQPVLKMAFGELIPYFDRHTYLIALIGVLFFYGIHAVSQGKKKERFWLTLIGYMLFNFFVGASLSDSANPDIQPVVLFTFAIAMHYFVRDHNTKENSAPLFEHQGRWGLVLALLAGYITGRLSHIPDAIVALLISFLAGGIFLNVLRYELPKNEKEGYVCFATGALLYTAILIFVGQG